MKGSGCRGASAGSSWGAVSLAGALPVALWTLSPSRCFVSHLRSQESGDLLVLQGACVRWVLLGGWGWERGICKLPLSSLPPSQGVSPQGGGAGTRVRDPLGAALLGRPQGTLCHSQTGALPGDRSPSSAAPGSHGLGLRAAHRGRTARRWHGDGIQLCGSHLGQDGTGSFGSMSSRSAFEGSNAVAY